MLTALTLCASLLIAAADPEKTADKTPAASAVKVENSKPEEKNTKKTDDKATEKTAKESTEKPEDKQADESKEDATKQESELKASADKSDEKSEKKESDKSKEDAGKDKKDPKAASDKSGDKKAEPKGDKAAEPKKDKDEELLAIEANIVAYTNTERARYGLPPLAVDKNLMKTAREHGSWMAWNRVFQHTRRPVAENIAMGQPSSQDVVRSWMNSSGHRANILNPGHGHIGVGAYRTEGGTIYWVQQFSR